MSRPGFAIVIDREAIRDDFDIAKGLHEIPSWADMMGFWQNEDKSRYAIILGLPGRMDSPIMFLNGVDQPSGLPIDVMLRTALQMFCKGKRILWTLVLNPIERAQCEKILRGDGLVEFDGTDVPPDMDAPPGVTKH